MRVAALAVALCLTLAACGSTPRGADAADGGEVTVADTVRAAEMPRVAALSKSIGELWLLAGGDLAGATEDAFELDAVSEETVSVGTITKPNLEAILALQPDIVLLTASVPAQRELIDGLSRAGIEALDVDINSFGDYAEAMRDFTARTGRSDLYEQNVEQIRTGIEAVLARVPKRESKAAETYLALRVSSTKNTVLKGDNFACAMIDDFGFRNIADDGAAFDELSLEAVAAADPDRIFIVLQGDEEKAQESFQAAFADHPVWGGLTAAREDKVTVLPKDYFQYKPNARWAEAYEYLYGILFQ